MMRKLLAVVAMAVVAGHLSFPTTKHEPFDVSTWGGAYQTTPMNAPKWAVQSFIGAAYAAPPTMVTPNGNDFVLWTGAAGDTTAVGMADSTGYLTTGQFERLYLYIKPDRPCSFAIQVRSHGKADSNFVTLQDSTDTFVWPFSAITYAALRTDSLVWLENDFGNTDRPAESELVVRLTRTAASTMMWASPRGMVIPLRRESGDWYWGKVTTIRIRNLSANGAVTWTGSLRGVPWGGYR